MESQVSLDRKQQVLADLVYWLKCTLEGVHCLSEEAFLNPTLKNDLSNKIIQAKEKINSSDFQSIPNDKVQGSIQKIYQHQKILEQVRDVLNEVIRCNKPETQNFKVRLVYGLDYSQKMQASFEATDQTLKTEDKEQQALATPSIIEQVQEQFDDLSKMMVDAITAKDIQIQDASTKIAEKARMKDREVVEKVLQEIDTSKKRDHQVYKDLTKKIQNQAKEEFKKKCSNALNQILQHDVPKILTTVDSYNKYLDPLKSDPHALEFFLIFYSGYKNKTINNPQQMFPNFILYCKKKFGENFIIEENSINQQEFIKALTPEGNLSVKLENLKLFFQKNVDMQKQKINLAMAEHLNNASLEKNLPQQKEEEMKNSKDMVKLKMEVLKDFDTSSNKYDDERKTDGILKAGGEPIVFEMENGKTLTFGRDPLGNVVIPLHEEDMGNLQFSVYNSNGKLYLVDQYEDQGEPTHIKCNLKTKYRLNTNDYINLGLTASYGIIMATSENLPPPDTSKQLEQGSQYFNHRMVPDGISESLFKQSKDASLHCAATPQLRLQPISANLDLKETVIWASDLETKSFKLGRQLSGNPKKLDLEIPLPAVSGEHLIISYDKELGWLMENLSESNGTYIHPKEYSQVQVNDPTGSSPMPLESGTIVKAHSFEFRFTLC